MAEESKSGLDKFSNLFQTRTAPTRAKRPIAKEGISITGFKKKAGPRKIKGTSTGTKTIGTKRDQRGQRDQRDQRESSDGDIEIEIVDDTMARPSGARDDGEITGPSARLGNDAPIQIEKDGTTIGARPQDWMELFNQIKGEATNERQRTVQKMTKRKLRIKQPSNRMTEQQQRDMEDEELSKMFDEDEAETEAEAEAEIEVDGEKAVDGAMDASIVPKSATQPKKSIRRVLKRVKSTKPPTQITQHGQLSRNDTYTKYIELVKSLKQKYKENKSKMALLNNTTRSKYLSERIKHTFDDIEEKQNEKRYTELRGTFLKSKHIQFTNKLNEWFSNPKYHTEGVEGEFSLQAHQKIISDYLSEYTPYRGLLLYHGLGSGKTCSSIAIAEGLKSSRQVFVFTPASLQDNFRKELEKCGDEMYRRGHNWYHIPSFIAYTSNYLSSIKTTDERNELSRLHKSLLQYLASLYSIDMEHVLENGIWVIYQKDIFNKKAETYNFQTKDDKMSKTSIRNFIPLHDGEDKSDASMVDIKPILSMNEEERASLQEQIKMMIESKYQFYNYNSPNFNKNIQELRNNLKKKHGIYRNPFDNKVIVIDEVHNFVSRIVNKLKEKRGTLGKAMKSLNAKINVDDVTRTSLGANIGKSTAKPSPRTRGAQPQSRRTRGAQGATQADNPNELAFRIVPNLMRRGRGGGVQQTGGDPFIGTELFETLGKASYILQMYHEIMSAQNARIVFLSGTPIINYPNEFAVLYNMLRGYDVEWIFNVVNADGSITSKLSSNDANQKRMALQKNPNFDQVLFEASVGEIRIIGNPYGFESLQGDQNMLKIGSNGDRDGDGDGKNDDQVDNVVNRFLREAIKTLYSSEHGFKIRTNKVEPIDLGIDTSEEGDEGEEGDKGEEGKESKRKRRERTTSRILELEEINTIRNFVSPEFVRIRYTKPFYDTNKEFQKKYLNTGNSGDVIKDTRLEDASALVRRAVTGMGNDKSNLGKNGTNQASLYNMGLIIPKILGYTSYFRSARENLMPTYDPDVDYIKIFISMSDYQFGEYALKRSFEIREESAKRNEDEMDEDEQITSSYKTESRKACNFVFPEIMKKLIQVKEIKGTAVEADAGADAGAEVDVEAREVDVEAREADVEADVEADAKAGVEADVTKPKSMSIKKKPRIKLVPKTSSKPKQNGGDCGCMDGGGDESEGESEDETDDEDVIVGGDDTDDDVDQAEMNEPVETEVESGPSGAAPLPTIDEEMELVQEEPSEPQLDSRLSDIIETNEFEDGKEAPDDLYAAQDMLMEDMSDSDFNTIINTQNESLESRYHFRLLSIENMAKIRYEMFIQYIYLPAKINKLTRIPEGDRTVKNQQDLNKYTSKKEFMDRYFEEYQTIGKQFKEFKNLYKKTSSEFNKKYPTKDEESKKQMKNELKEVLLESLIEQFEQVNSTSKYPVIYTSLGEMIDPLNDYSILPYDKTNYIQDTVSDKPLFTLLGGIGKYSSKIATLMSNILNPTNIITQSGSAIADEDRKLGFKSMSSHDGCHLVYSAFRQNGGIQVISKVFDNHEMVQLKLETRNGVLHISDDTIRNAVVKDKDTDEVLYLKPMYAMYTGTESRPERKIIQQIFNGQWELLNDPIRKTLETYWTDENIRRHKPLGSKEIVVDRSEDDSKIDGLVRTRNVLGDVIKVLLITQAGAEGLDLKNIRYVHILEPYWHPVRVEQVIGRANRIRSHHSLPPSMRTVKVFSYLMNILYEQVNTGSKEKHASMIRKKDRSRLLVNQVVDPSKLPKVNGEVPPRIVTTDLTLYEVSQRKKMNSMSLLDMIKRSAIDCGVYPQEGRQKEDIKCWGST